MSTPIVTNQEYPIDQGQNVIITAAGIITLQAKYKDGTAWVPLETVDASGSAAAGVYDMPFLKEALFRVTAQAAETRFDISPQT